MVSEGVKLLALGMLFENLGCIQAPISFLLFTLWVSVQVEPINEFWNILLVFIGEKLDLKILYQCHFFGFGGCAACVLVTR